MALPRRRFDHADSLPLHILYTERVFLYDPRGDGDGEEQPQALPVELGRLVVPEGRGERAWSHTGMRLRRHAPPAPAAPLVGIRVRVRVRERVSGQGQGSPRTVGSSCAASSL